MRRTSRSLLVAFLVITACFACGAWAQELRRGIVQYEAVPAPLSIQRIPGLNLQFPHKSVLFALQFGPKATDVAYLVLDAARRGGEFARMSVFVAGHELYGEPKVSRGRKNESVVRFKKFPLNTKFGHLKVEYHVAVETEEHIVRAAVECCVTGRSGTKNEFQLVYTVTSKAESEAEPATVIRLIEVPEVIFNLDNRSDPPKLSGQLKMGKWKLLPDGPKQARIELLVYGRGEEVRLRRKMGLQKILNGSFRIHLHGRLKAGLEYDAEVTVDMGRFFGVVKGRRLINQLP